MGSNEKFGSSDDWVTPALQSLNSEITKLDAIEVLSLMPEKWLLSAIQQFLSETILQTMHRRRLSLITRGLADTHNKNVRHRKLITQRQLLFINEDSVCSVCGNAINEPQFIWLPNLQIVLHPHCAKGITTISTKSND